MASVNYMKIKDVPTLKNTIRHCDLEKRTNTKEHANKHIDKSLTKKNIQMANRSFDVVCERFDKRLSYLDSLPNANTRKDRVIAFGLDIPAPASLKSRADNKKWFAEVYKCVARQYGQENILQMYIHYDEQHEYVNAFTGEIQESRAHAHIFVIPEHDGKLNGKWFSSRNNMRALNESIHAMTQSAFDCDFMTGSKRKSKHSVESLKMASERIELQKDVKVLQEEKNRLKGQIKASMDVLQELEDEQEKKMQENADFRAFIKKSRVQRESNTRELIEKAKDILSNSKDFERTF